VARTCLLPHSRGGTGCEGPSWALTASAAPKPRKADKSAGRGTLGPQLLYRSLRVTLTRSVMGVGPTYKISKISNFVVGI
jgi:hypothetical protein